MAGRRTTSWLRHGVQCAALAAFALAGAYAALNGTVAGEGVFFGTLSSSTTRGTLVLSDPFAAFEVIAASRAVPSAGLAASAGLIAAFYALVRGRAFCGWLCPFGLVSEIANWIGKKTKIARGRLLRDPLPRHSKTVAGGLVLAASALAGLPVFELLSPVAFLPRLFAYGVGVGLWLFVALVAVELFFTDRLWCRGLCPLGGFYEAIGSVGLVRVAVREGCTGCEACKRACLADPRILDGTVAGTAGSVTAGDCMLCGRCIEACPVRVLSFGVGGPALLYRKSAPAAAPKEAACEDDAAQDPGDER
ncbi:MAG: 4Fe-4S binding protein [Coriobacteriales bacterium]|jgi:ferredoxin-type protein NapH|nr:4Fe-4S binding protein [Coriobacteriales bacterium]